MSAGKWLREHHGRCRRKGVWPRRVRALKKHLKAPERLERLARADIPCGFAASLNFWTAPTTHDVDIEAELIRQMERVRARPGMFYV